MPDSKYYDKLNRLRLGLKKKSAMNMSGNRKSVMKGSSAEFSDFREYIQGDDIRRVDWNAYARLDRLYIKEYMEEKEAVINIIIDTSASMCYGKKTEMVKSLACALSYIALSGMDRVMIYDVKNMERAYKAGTGKRAFAELVKWVEGMEFSGSADLYGAVLRWQAKGPGLTIIISDFLSEDFIPAEYLSASDGQKGKKAGKKSPKAGDKISPGAETGTHKMLAYLNYCRQETALIQVLADEELNVDMAGTFNLTDMETDEKLKLTMNQSVIDRYMEGVNGLINNLKRSAAKNGATYALVNAADEFDKVIFEGLKDIYDI